LFTRHCIYCNRLEVRIERPDKHQRKYVVLVFYQFRFKMFQRNDSKSILIYFIFIICSVKINSNRYLKFEIFHKTYFFAPDSRFQFFILKICRKMFTDSSFGMGPKFLVLMLSIFIVFGSSRIII
jgi:hypothetical protein